MATERRFKIRNIHRITAQQWAKAEGYNSAEDAMSDYAGEPGMPALCSQGCWVASNAECEHGNPSPKFGMVNQ